MSAEKTEVKDEVKIVVDESKSGAAEGADLIEARFGKLSRDSLIADGKKAKVYRVKDLKTNKMVIVKLSRPRYEVFIRSEYDLLALFKDSSRIVQVLDILTRPYPSDDLNEELRARSVEFDEYGERIKNPQPYSSRHLQVILVLELMDDDLFEYLENNIDLDTEIDARDIMWQLCLAISECKKMGVIHRDLKPENFFVKNRDQVGESEVGKTGVIVKLGDFDLSTLATKEGRYCLGTPLFRSPELLDIHLRKAGYEGDVWAAGCIFARILCLPLFTSKDFSIYPRVQEWEEQAVIIRQLGTSSTTRYDWMESCQDPSAKDLLRSMLTIDYKDRITIEDVLLHPYFKPLPKSNPLESESTVSAGESVITTSELAMNTTDD